VPPWESVETTERVCASCGEKFAAKRANARYCSDRCRERARAPRPYDPEKSRAWREARLARPGYRERVNERDNARRTAVRRWLDAYKIRVGCVDCGYREHAIALDFDHIGDLKNRNVCNSRSIAQAQEEIALCEVRCANCHRIKTHERRYSAGS